MIVCLKIRGHFTSCFGLIHKLLLIAGANPRTNHERTASNRGNVANLHYSTREHGQCLSPSPSITTGTNRLARIYQYLLHTRTELSKFASRSHFQPWVPALADDPSKIGE
jgi:hypothetical protein